MNNSKKLVIQKIKNQIYNFPKFYVDMMCESLTIDILTNKYAEDYINDDLLFTINMCISVPVNSITGEIKQSIRFYE